MNYARIVLAAVAATVVYFLCGDLVFGALIARYYAPYSGVYRSADAIQGYFPIGMAYAFEESVGFFLLVPASQASIVVRSFPLLDVCPSDDKL